MLNSLNLYSNIQEFHNFSPLDQFEVNNLFSFSAPLLGNFHISLTNLGFYTFLVFLIIN